MTSRERVKRAINFQRPDRIPHYLPDGKTNDILWMWPERPAPQKDWYTIGDHDQMTDHWGVTFQRMAGGRIGRGEVLYPSLPDITQQESFIFPDMNNSGYLEEIRKQIEGNNRTQDPKYCLGVMSFGSLNEGIHNNMGIQSMFLAYYEHPEHLKKLIARFAEAQKESIRLLAEAGCDGVMAYDDWGLQDSLMISREMINEFFMPHYRENWSYAHSLGVDVWLHSCGYIIEILPDLIDAGLTVVQMDQQENMGLENLAKKTDHELAFWCPVDIQRTMIEGTLQEIRDYAKKMITTLGSVNGGYISMAYSTPEDVNHTPEKLTAMSNSFRLHEGYFNK
jgi:uroporphyrinogen decarboxylase